MGGVQSSEQVSHGFHVLRVKENSPAHLANIEQLFDYIVGVNGEGFEDGEKHTLVQMIQANEGKQVELIVYSSRDQRLRVIPITPSRDWHNDPNEKSLIGCAVRYCTSANAGESVWHILDVAPNSPAEMAGIISQTDYIVGSPNMVMQYESDLYELVESSLGKQLILYVYNSAWDNCREVIIVPDQNWGGNGSLGCDVGFGILHKIPQRPLPEDPKEPPQDDHEANTDQEATLDPEKVLQDARSTNLPPSPKESEM